MATVHVRLEALEALAGDCVEDEAALETGEAAEEAAAEEEEEEEEEEEGGGGGADDALAEEGEGAEEGCELAELPPFGTEPEQPEK